MQIDLSSEVIGLKAKGYSDGQVYSALIVKKYKGEDIQEALDEFNKNKKTDKYGLNDIIAHFFPKKEKAPAPVEPIIGAPEPTISAPDEPKHPSTLNVIDEVPKEAVRAAHIQPPSNQNTYLIIGGLAVVILLLGAWFIMRPVCGNGELEKGETSETCCADAGCAGEMTCEETGCKEPVCGTCQYLEDHFCLDHECCDDLDCGANQTCEFNECTDLSCGACQYLEDHKCFDYICCADADCDDSDPLTVDICINGSTLDAKCLNREDECQIDTDCDDSDDSTEDLCIGVPKVCENNEITVCVADGYCPANCTYVNDDDCDIVWESCSDIDCLIDASAACEPAKYEMTSDYEISGVEITATSEMKMFKNGNKCDFRSIVTGATGALSDDLIDLYEDLNYSDDDIDDMEEVAGIEAQLGIGAGMSCNVTAFSELTDNLESVKDGDMNSTIICLMAANSTQCSTEDDWEDIGCKAFKPACSAYVFEEGVLTVIDDYRITLTEIDSDDVYVEIDSMEKEIKEDKLVEFKSPTIHNVKTFGDYAVLAIDCEFNRTI